MYVITYQCSDKSRKRLITPCVLIMIASKLLFFLFKLWLKKPHGWGYMGRASQDTATRYATDTVLMNWSWLHSVTRLLHRQKLVAMWLSHSASARRVGLSVYETRICWVPLPSNPAWISNQMHGKVWDIITYPFPNFNGWTCRNG